MPLCSRCAILHDDGVRALAQPCQQPVGGLFVTAGSGDARAERHLRLDVAERPLPVESPTAPPRTAAPPAPPAPAPAPGLPLAGGRCGQQGYRQHSHRICPTLVLSWTNAVMTSCAVLRLICRSSFTRYAICSPALSVGGKSVSMVSWAWDCRLST